MAEVSQGVKVVPSPRIPKVLGILNIVFASGLILGGLCMGAYTALLPALSKAMTQMQKKAEADAEARRQADLKKVEEAENASGTEEEKRQLEAERQAILARPKANMPGGMDMSKLYDMPELMPYGWIDVLSGLAVNLAMLAAGIGLVRRKLWGIRLGIWTAAAKIVRLVLLYTFFALVVVPAISERMGKVVGEMMVQQQQAMGRPAPPGFDAKFMVRTYSIMYTVSAVAMILFGSIYPAVSIWLLTRPGARAACDEKQLPPDLELNETW